jgi:hypothetical protein
MRKHGEDNDGMQKRRAELYIGEETVEKFDISRVSKWPLANCTQGFVWNHIFQSLMLPHVACFL